MQRDALDKLIGAVVNLQEVIRSMGPELTLASIAIDDGNNGDLLDSHLRSSPSYLMAHAPMDQRRPSAREIMGVKIEIVRK